MATTRADFARPASTWQTMNLLTPASDATRFCGTPCFWSARLSRARLSCG